MAEVVIPYAPRQVFKPYHNRTQRWAAIVAHRRCGKTVACINDLIRRAMLLETPHGRYAYVAPFLAQAKEVAWDYLKRFSRPLIRDVNEAELRVTLVNGASIRIHGADNPDRLRGSYLDGVVLDEFADMRPSVWGEVIRPMLADRRGWATFIGTPKGHNAFYDLCYGDPAKEIAGAVNDENWYFTVLRASQTGILDDAELASMRTSMTPEQFEQEAECSFEAAIMGAYFGKEVAQAEREGRIRDVPYDPAVYVHTAWDLGYGDPTAIWFFQIVGREIHVIDWYESNGVPLSHYFGVLKDRGYKYGEHFLPHDAKASELIAGRTRVEEFAKSVQMPRVLPMLKVMDGINGARVTLPRCYFDKIRCAAGLEALRQYRADFDEKAKVFKNEPKHDWTSHTADAFRYLAMAWREIAPDAMPKTEQQKQAEAVAEMLKPKTYADILKMDEVEA